MVKTPPMRPESSKHQLSSANPFSSVGNLLLLAGILAIPGCSGGGGSGGSPGAVSQGNASLQTVEYGRLVEVRGFVRTESGGPEAGTVKVERYLADVMVGPDIVDQRGNQQQVPDDEITYDFLNSNPENLQPILLITREIGSEEFKAAFDALDDNLRQVNGAIFGQDPNLNQAFSVVPRNAGIRLTFSSALGVDSSFFYSTDPDGRITGVKNTEAVQLLEIAGDPTDARDEGDFKVIPTRVVARNNHLIVDPVLLGTEGIQLQAKNNAAGMPESPDQEGANIRIAVALEGPLALKQISAGSEAVSLIGKNNSALKSLVRDFRSGNANDNSADLSRGFVRDPAPPRIVGELLMFLERVDDINDSTQRITLYKNEKDHEIDLGDVIRIINPANGEVFASTDVIEEPSDDRGKPGVQHVRMNVRRVAGLEAIDPSNDPAYPIDLAERERWLRLNAPRSVLVAEFTASREDPTTGVIVNDDLINFVSFTPGPLPLIDGSPSPQNENVSPFAGAIIRFSKPVDMTTLRSLDSFFFATRNVLDDEVILGDHVAPLQLDPSRFFPNYKDKYITPHLVVSRIFDEDGSQTALRLQPTMGFYLDQEMRDADEGKAFSQKRFEYYVHLLGGPRGIRDLAGNQLDFQSAAGVLDFIAVPFSLDTRQQPNNPSLPMFEDNLVVNIARRFADTDEDEQPSVYLPSEMPLTSFDNQTNFPNMLARVDDVFGEVTFLSEGKLQARGTSRFRQVVDNLNQRSPTQSGPLAWCPSMVSGLFNSDRMIVSATAASPFFAGGIQNPLNPFGARLQSVWREVDFSLSRINPADFNLDVEQMYWAPFTQSPITFDEFDRISLFLGHSEKRPEVCLGAGDALPLFYNSGLVQKFEDNFAFNPKATNNLEKDDPPPPHPAFLETNMVIDSGRTFTEPNGVNRYLPLPEFQEPYFVWRDETSTVQGGEAGFLNGGGLARSSDTFGQRYAPFIASPFLGGSGRLTTVNSSNSVVTNTGYWGNGSGSSLMGTPGSPGTSVLGASRRIERFSGGTIAAMGLPLLADFQILPDDPDLPVNGGFVATGFNGWQISVPVQSSFYPFFRAYSGGFSGGGNSAPIFVSPSDLAWSQAASGFNLDGTPSCITSGMGGINVGVTVCGLDNSVYWIMADFLKRQSVVTAGFVEILNPHRMPPRVNGDGDPRLGPYFSQQNGSFALPTGVLPSFDWSTEPPLDQLPAGTQIVPEFRAASRLENDSGSLSTGRGLPEGFWRWAVHDPGIPTGPVVPNPFTTAIYADAERPDEINFPLNPLTAGDAGIRKWDERVQPDSGQSRNFWAYYYNRHVTDYTSSLGNLMDELFLEDFVSDNESFGPRDVKYFNWRFTMRNNVEANPPVSPELESFAVTYRFERR